MSAGPKLGATCETNEPEPQPSLLDVRSFVAPRLWRRNQQSVIAKFSGGRRPFGPDLGFELGFQGAIGALGSLALRLTVDRRPARVSASPRGPWANHDPPGLWAHTLLQPRSCCRKRRQGRLRCAVPSRAKRAVRRGETHRS
jgi:hypothetical protein